MQKQTYTIIRLLSVVLLLTLLVINFSGGNPFLTADPTENLVDYYVISINGEETTVQPSFDQVLMYDLKDLPDGKHSIEVISGNWEMGDGHTINFFIDKKTTNKWIHYSIKEDQNSPIIDYYERFDQPLRIKVENTHQSSSNERKKFINSGSSCS